MFETRLQKLLGIELPILGGTMMDLSTPAFVAAISEAGALGIVASAMYKDPEDFRHALRAVRRATQKPFAVNINLFPMMEKMDNFLYLEIMRDEGVTIAETSGFAPPADLVAKIRDSGMTWVHKCVGPRYAKKAAALGADAVTVVGFENGGATGTLNIGTMVLTPVTVDAVAIPVIAGGGVVDGRTFLAVLALGAAGAVIGTRLMLSEECPLHRNVKEALLRATESDTDVIMRTVQFPHRVWMNDPSKKVAEIEKRGGGIDEIYPYVSGEAARKMYEHGDVQAGSISCSQGIGLIREIKPVKDILQEIVGDARRRCASLFETASPSG